MVVKVKGRQPETRWRHVCSDWGIIPLKTTCTCYRGDGNQGRWLSCLFFNNSKNIDISILDKDKNCTVLDFIFVYQILSKSIENYWNNQQKTSGMRYLPVLIAHIGSFCRLYL